MTLRMSRSQCEVTLALAGAEHVYSEAGHWEGYAIRRNGRIWKPSYTLGRRNRRLAKFVEQITTPAGFTVVEGWTGWRIDELRMAVKQIVQGERPSGP
jgi:hypothetical protein